MSDYVNKVVTIILVFVMLVLAPLLISYMTTDMRAQRLVLNDTTNFIDRVTDKGSITQEDLDQFYLSINSHGLILDANVKRLVRVATTVPGGEIKTVYFPVEDMSFMNTGDVVQVNVEEVGISGLRNITYNILKIDNGQFKFNLAGAVR